MKCLYLGTEVMGRTNVVGEGTAPSQGTPRTERSLWGKGQGHGAGGWDKRAIALENAQRIPFVAVGTISYHLLTEHLLLLSPVGGILCVVTASYEVGAVTPILQRRKEVQGGQVTASETKSV